ncbi:HAMP domain-containing histidine kinase [Candidatus Saccharibacteria bacterium]|nr:HAMP domain-containing histidine kinase [Candidatus Saccharibacteria bacterium]
MFYLAIAGYLIVKERFKLAAWFVIGLYTAIAAAILWSWSINAQVGLLTLGFVIVLTSTLLGARYILPFTAGIVVLLIYFQIASSLGITTPDTSSLSNKSTAADVIGYSIIFCVFALIAWLSRRQMEQALRRALGAEAALEQEKKLLAVRLEAQTKHLREVQLEEMHQLYRFAELGQISTFVLHELANYLTILTLDIDDIGQRHYQSQAVTNAKESIGHLDQMVDQVRRRLQENNETEDINIPAVIRETLETLNKKIADARISVSVKKAGVHSNSVIGDPLVLSQALAILLNNAIDAYGGHQSKKERKIEISISFKAHSIDLFVTDYGVGISAEKRLELFEPFRSTKVHGMGIGLYIAKKMIESHFNGSLTLDSSTRRTRFIISLPAHLLKK